MHHIHHASQWGQVKRSENVQAGLLIYNSASSFRLSKVEAVSDAHGKAKDENHMESRPRKQSLKKKIQEAMKIQSKSNPFSFKL